MNFDVLAIGLCVGAAVVYMGVQVWHMVRGTGETSCGCGKACSAVCSGKSQNAGTCGLRDFRKN